MGEAAPVEVVEHVRLVLRRVDSHVKLWATRTGHHARVVTGRERVEPELEHATEHQVEAHEGVAANAGVWCSAFDVVAVERLDHALGELSLEVPAVIRNAQQ